MKHYKCENKSCNREWTEVKDFKIEMDECPYCGCKYLLVEVIRQYEQKKNRHNKK